MFYFNIKSGSTGNCSLINFGTNYFLVDIGVSYRYLLQALSHVNVCVSKIKFIFITHEHSDHIKGLSAFIRENKNVVVFCSKYTALKLLLDNFDFASNIRILRKHLKYKIGSMSVLALETHHDALDSFGYIFYYKKRKMCYMTDLGTITDVCRSLVVPCDYIVLESNYEKNMLLFSSYPYVLKTRITSVMGHLSNEQASNLALLLAKNGVKYIFLTHLSRSTNTHNKAYYSTLNKVREYGVKVIVNNFEFKDKIMLED